MLPQDWFEFLFSQMSLACVLDTKVASTVEKYASAEKGWNPVMQHIWNWGGGALNETHRKPFT